MRISPLKKEAKQSSSPTASTLHLDEESKHGETDSSRHCQETIATLEQQIKEYEKRMKDLEYEVVILQLKVRELDANDKSHLACKVEAHSLRKDKEAAEALATAYKELVQTGSFQGPFQKVRPQREEGAQMVMKVLRNRFQLTKSKVE